MSEVESFWCHEASNIRCVRASDYDALRQQLADVSNERDELRNQCAGIHQQLEICQKQRDNRQDRLNASEARNAGERDRLIDAYEGGYGDGQNNPNGYSSEETRDTYISELLARPAPATCKHRFVWFGDQKKRRCADCSAVEDAPATDEQGAGS